MNPRIICPHCHRPIDPTTLEDAICANTRYLICPECDDPIVLAADTIAPALPPLTDSEEGGCAEFAVARLEAPASVAVLAESHAR